MATRNNLNVSTEAFDEFLEIYNRLKKAEEKGDMIFHFSVTQAKVLELLCWVFNAVYEEGWTCERIQLNVPCFMPKTPTQGRRRKRYTSFQFYVAATLLRDHHKELGYPPERIPTQQEVIDYMEENPDIRFRVDQVVEKRERKVESPKNARAFDGYL